MSRDTQNVVLVLLGAALVKIAATDVYLRYVKPSHQWWLLAAGLIMLALAVVSIVRDVSARRSGAPVPTHEGHEHSEQRSPWLLILPVLAILLVAPPALGEFSVNRATGGNAVAPASVAGEFDALPVGTAPELGLSEFVMRAAWDGSGSLARQDVTLTGFVVRKGGSVLLARMVLSCCAADARPMLVRLAGTDLDARAGEWLRVRARLLPGSATTADGYTPSVRVVDAQRITAPADPYEF